MASVVLRSAGAAVGNMFLPGIGGALLGAFAGNIGGVIDGQLGMGTSVTGPRLENLQVQDSRYGAGIPIIYGNARVAGNVIWSTNLIETQHNNNIGGKGGSTGVSETVYTYSVHCAIGICAGSIAGFDTVWADSQIIYQNGAWVSGLFDGVTFYTGTSGQTPDPFMQSIIGSTQVPSYKNLAYIVFDNLQLANFGSRLPNLTFEIIASTSSNGGTWLGGVDAGISQRIDGVISGTMAPISLQGASADVQTVLIGGSAPGSGAASFKVSAYDVTEDSPALLYSVTSAGFTSAIPPADVSWALSPDGRFVALYLQSTATPTHNFVIYDSEAQTFGAIYSVNLLTSSSVCKQIAWVDAQHFVIDDSVSGVRGLHVFARAGTGIIDLGFTGVWGAGSSSSTFALYNAQFTQYAGGLMYYTWVSSGAKLQACSVAWRNNSLSFGTIYNISSGTALSTGSNPNACFIQSASNQWTLFYGTVTDYNLISFEPGALSAVITRPWQRITFTTGIGTSNFPVFWGDRLLVVRGSTVASSYFIDEVLLSSGSFAVAATDEAVADVLPSSPYFNAMKLDSGRILFMGMSGTVYDIGQLGIIERNDEGSVGAILTDILTRAGYASGDFDVAALNSVTIQGYMLSEPMSARKAIEPLQVYTPFDLIETNAQLLAVPRGGNAGATVPCAEWRAAAEGKVQPPPLLITRAEEMDLPREIDVDFVDPARNYEINCQRARRIATSARAVQKVSLPVITDIDTAKQIAETRLYTAWAERDLVKISVSRTWLALDPSDVVDLNNGNLLRIASLTQSNGLIQVEGFYSYAASLSSSASADGGQSLISDSNASVPSTLYMMDLPLLQSSDDQPGVYAAVTGLAGWKGASIMRSSDGVTYTAIDSLSIATISGIATNVLPNASGLYMDNVGTVNVQLIQGSLSSCNFIDMTNGMNAALLGSEIIQFQTATLIGPGLYTLGNLLRGRRGTESQTGTHVIGENFVLLQAGAVDFIPDILNDRGNSYDFRAIGKGQSLSSANDYVFTYGMQTICPFSPVNIVGVRANGTSGDLVLTWNRRARLNGEWVDYIDVPLDEPVELYEVDIMNGTSIMRAFTGVTSSTVTYTAAEQTADWGGSIPSSFTINIYQISSRYGNGNVATAVI